MNHSEQPEYQEQEPQTEGYQPQTVTVEVDPVKLELVAGKNGGAGWMSTVAVLAIVNSALTFLNMDLRFIFSLGVADIASYIAQGSESGGLKVIAISIALASTGTFLWLAHNAKKGRAWAFILGMLLYALGGGLWVLGENWLEVGCHAFAVFMMYKGLSASQQLKKLYPNEFK